MSETTEVSTRPQTAVDFPARAEFELALRQAKVYAASTIVPKEYQDNLPNCLVALNMAKRIGADPLQVLQNLYIVHGRPGWSAQFLIATFNQCGKFSALRFEWQGKQGQKDWGCRAYATEKATGERIEGAWITWGMVEAEGWNKKAGSKWLTMPSQMFMYRAAAWLVRTHAPELAMGLQTVEEVGDVIDVTPEPAARQASGIDALKAAVQKVVEPAPAPAASEPEQGAPTYAEIADIIAKSDGNAEAIDAALCLIHPGIPEEQRAELAQMAKDARAA